MYPPYTNTGIPITMSQLKLGQKFRHDGYPGEYQLIADNPHKVKRPDGWHTRVNDLNKVVYIDL